MAFWVGKYGWKGVRANMSGIIKQYEPLGNYQVLNDQGGFLSLKNPMVVRHSLDGSLPFSGACLYLLGSSEKKGKYI